MACFVITEEITKILIQKYIYSKIKKKKRLIVQKKRIPSRVAFNLYK